MVRCDGCGMWVHPGCADMDEETYTSYFNNLPGYERYECPDCKGDGPNATQTWRSLDRLVSKIQHRRAQFAPKKVPKEEGWWKGEIKGKRGMFPASYVKPVRDKRANKWLCMHAWLQQDGAH